MLTAPLFWLMAAAALAVAAILIFGIGSFAKGGEFNRRNANRIMRWRLLAQFIAVLLLVAFAWSRQSGG
ncbi:twin transmembrane helix small protein [Xinfangfangia sp. D13-10-4-6]|uniref:twin transmembrane helix small protein n=1 Tax=Pseudogemmobacter hezensis TaxID=2737662 RepID=UPI00155559CB|nr:twin transmembrane helix small protein [Pseudogemmobacter hezensis]NPD17759.1 twin transmembrane helix small protein [Pseudogemmobacter hezensis]